MKWIGSKPAPKYENFFDDSVYGFQYEWRMQANIRERLIGITRSNGIADVQTIQPLWNNYGTLSRVHLTGGQYPSVIVKHIKIPEQQSHPRGFGGSISRRRKILSYKIETHWYQKYNPVVGIKSVTPKCLDAFDSGNEMFLVLEDLSVLGFGESLYSVDWNQFRVVLDWLANFHAQFLHSPADGLWPCGTYWHLATRPDELARIKGSRIHCFASLIDARLQNSSFQTIVHGDAKLANFCFTKDGSGVAAVDFQYVGKGCGMKDLAYFIGSCLTESESQRLEPVILEEYFSRLHGALAGVDVDLQALESEWRELYPVACADFQRFMLGWSPAHRKLTTHSDIVTDNAISGIVDELLGVARTACLSAGRYIQENRNRHFEVGSKGFAGKAADVVTEIDLKAQDIILDALSPTIDRYDLGLLAEEGVQDNSRLEKHAFWTIDPLDGTQHYVEGRGGYATSIALVSKEGKTILGVVYDPVNDKIYHAVRGQGFHINGVRQEGRAGDLDSALTKWYADRSLMNHPNFEEYRSRYDIRFVGGAVMNIIRVITESNSLYMKEPKKALGGCAIWDLAAASLMLEEYGGTAQFYDGSPLLLNREDTHFFNDVGLLFLSPDLNPEDFMV